MKNLKGMKSTFSSLENKKLRNLCTIRGGEDSVRTAPSNAVGEGCADEDVYTDAGGTRDNWQYKARLTACDHPFY